MTERVTELPREIVDGAGVRLREPRESDAEDIAAACQDQIIRRFLPGLAAPYTLADALKWITEAAPRQWATGGAVFVVVDPATDRLLGSAGIGRVVGGRGQGEVGYWVAPWARGRGVARAAVNVLTAWAFHHGFGRMELLTAPENAASQRVALAAGYRYEGVRRAGGVGPGGRRHDLVAWTRLRDDPPGPTPRLLPDLPGAELTDGVVALRPVRAADAEEFFALRSLPEVVATTVPPEPPDRDAEARRCARAESRWLAGERVDLTIRDAASGRFAGTIGLYYHEPVTRQATIGYSLLPAWRGHGYATRAVRLMAGWALRHTGIERVVAGTAPDNVGSQRVLERAGFIREGLLRGRLPTRTGGRADDLLYGLLASDIEPATDSEAAPDDRAAT